jgi:hypothetical protein
MPQKQAQKNGGKYIENNLHTHSVKDFTGNLEPFRGAFGINRISVMVMKATF